MGKINLKLNLFVGKICVVLFSIMVLFSCEENQTNEDFVKFEIEQLNDANFISEEDILNNAACVYAEYCNLNLKDEVNTYSGDILDNWKDKKIKEIHAVKKDANALTSCYIVNFVDSGFIILSADKRMPEVLAFSESSVFPVKKEALCNEDNPLGVRIWLNNVQSAASLLRIKNINVFDENESVQSYSSSYINLTQKFGPYLTTTKWGQRNGFNGLLYSNSCGEMVAAGCATIAASILMKYWEYPINYDWGNMLDNQPTVATQVLVKDIFYSSNATPGGCGKGTSTQVSSIINTLRSYGYNTSSYLVDKNNIKDQLREGKPVLMYARTEKNEGHLWVCDGYAQKGPLAKPWYNMIWGWYGECDGWYFIYGTYVTPVHLDDYIKYDFLSSTVEIITVSI